jgi:SAM-dependent methyltransferase
MKIVSVYVKVVSDFLNSLSFENKPDVVDLGCGDFNVGSQLRKFCRNYIACDIVPGLIDYNRSKFESLSVDFRVINIVADELPPGDVVFVRQVFQHLSNQQIGHILQKIVKNYKYLILTEHLPGEASFVPNVDKLPGPDIRTGVGSGIVITSSPFDFKSRREVLLCRACEGGGFIETKLFILT